MNSFRRLSLSIRFKRFRLKVFPPSRRAAETDRKRSRENEELKLSQHFSLFILHSCSDGPTNCWTLFLALHSPWHNIQAVTFTDLSDKVLLGLIRWKASFFLTSCDRENECLGATTTTKCSFVLCVCLRWSLRRRSFKSWLCFKLLFPKFYLRDESWKNTTFDKKELQRHLL